MKKGIINYPQQILIRISNSQAEQIDQTLEKFSRSEFQNKAELLRTLIELGLAELNSRKESK